VAITTDATFGWNSASNPGTSVATGVVASLHPAGHFGVCGVSINHASVTCSSVTDTQLNTWVKLGERKHATGAIYEALFYCASLVGGANNNVTANFTGAVTLDAGVMTGSWAGVLSWTTPGTQNEGTSALPTISITTQDPNNFVVAVLTTFGVGATTIASGVLDISDQNLTISQMLVHNTSATPASVTCSVNQNSGDWAACAIELRSVGAYPGHYVPRSMLRRSRSPGQTV
jgi:hypothetical protein